MASSKNSSGGISRFQNMSILSTRNFFEELALGQRVRTFSSLPAQTPGSTPALVCQTKPGELFICRVIGNIVPPYPDALGGVSATVEYAVGVLRVPVVVVCGHTRIAGVMRGALNPEPLEAYPNVRAWLRYANVEQREAKPSSEALLSLAEHNVVAQLDNLRSHPAVANRLKEGNLSLYGWVYHIATGTVTAYDEASGRFLHPDVAVAT